MTGCYNLFIRNCKLFFKDKGMFFASLITPVILLVLSINPKPKLGGIAPLGELSSSWSVHLHGC